MMARKLKVFRTPIGFHDAYVAVASQKDALASWGSDANLFARGMAEIVTDPRLTEEPLARPGEVIKVLRGSAKEHLAALPKDAGDDRRSKSSPPAAKTGHPPGKSSKPRPEPKLKPRPSRDRLDAAEQALTNAEGEHRAVLDDLRRRERELVRERQQVEKRQAAEIARLGRAAERAAAAYRRAMSNWRG